MNALRSYQILYLGLLAERRGLDTEAVASPHTTPRTLYAELDAAHRLGLDPAHFRAAINDEFASWDQPLADGDHVAFLPPMAGG